MPIIIIYGDFIEKLSPEFSKKMSEYSYLQEGNLVPETPLSLFLLFLTIVVMAPIVEEIIFRGVLYNLLSDRMSLIAAAMVSSIVFGLMHGAQFFQATVTGFVLAFIYQVTGDLKMAISAHAFNNGIVFVLGVLFAKGTGDGSFSEAVFLLFFIFSIIIIFISLVMVVVAVKYLRKNSLRSVFNDSAPMFKHEIFKRHHLDEMQEDEAVNFRFNV